MEPSIKRNAERRLRKAFQALQNFFIEFCRNSSIHGVRYFAEHRLHWTERLWWFISIGLSICLCSIFIRNIWTQWHVNPVVMSLTKPNIPLSAIPFPTVTICPEIKVQKNKFDLTSVYQQIREDVNNLTDTQRMQIRVTSHLCPTLLEILNADLMKIVESENFTSDFIYDEINSLSPNLNDTIMFCWPPPAFTPVPSSCEDFLTPGITHDGLCFTFNGLNSNEMYTDALAPQLMSVKNNPNISRWSLENGYQGVSDGNEYPIRVFETYDALVIIFSILEKDVDYHCKPDLGYRVFLSMPGESLKNPRHFLSVDPSSTTRIRIKPKLITTSEGLRYYTPNHRQCFFDSERQLRFFKIYTQHNCRVECLTQFMKIQCGCVHFSMPRKNGTKICGSAQIECYKRAERNLFRESAAIGYEKSSFKSFRDECNCLPACTSIEYDAELDREKTNFPAVAKVFSYSTSSLDGKKLARVFVYFKDHEVETEKRMEATTYSDFLAICGGLLGLFLGVSVLSIIEFIYFSTIHLYWIIRRPKVENSVIPINKQNANSVSIGIHNG